MKFIMLLKFWMLYGGKRGKHDMKDINLARAYFEQNYLNR